MYSRFMRTIRPRRWLMVALALGIVPAHAESWHADPISGCRVWDDEDAGGREVLVSWSAGCDDAGGAAGDGVLSWFENGRLKVRYAGAMLGGKANGWGVASTGRARGG